MKEAATPCQLMLGKYDTKSHFLSSEYLKWATTLQENNETI